MRFEGWAWKRITRKLRHHPLWWPERTAFVWLATACFEEVSSVPHASLFALARRTAQRCSFLFRLNGNQDSEIRASVWRQLQEHCPLRAWLGRVVRCLSVPCHVAPRRLGFRTFPLISKATMVKVSMGLREVLTQMRT